jgi:hypothetical protein
LALAHVLAAALSHLRYRIFKRQSAAAVVHHRTR